MRNVVAAMVLGLLGTGCTSLVPFTHEVRSQHDLRAEDIGKLQFYASHDITLRREAESGSRRIERGELRLSRGKIIEEIVIEKRTPGVALEVSETAIVVSFEEGSALTFSLRGAQAQPVQLLPPDPHGGFAEPPDPFPGSRERPAPIFDERSGAYFLTTEGGSNMVRFGGKLYEAVEESFHAHLLIDAEELEEVIESKTVLRGRRVTDRPRRLVPLGRL